jgi:hypothetical protein
MVTSGQDSRPHPVQSLYIPLRKQNPGVAVSLSGLEAVGAAPRIAEVPRFQALGCGGKTCYVRVYKMGPLLTYHGLCTSLPERLLFLTQEKKHV